MVLEVEFDLLDGGKNGEQIGVGLEMIYKIFSMQDAIFSGAEPFDCTTAAMHYMGRRLVHNFDPSKLIPTSSFMKLAILFMFP